MAFSLSLAYNPTEVASTGTSPALYTDTPITQTSGDMILGPGQSSNLKTALIYGGLLILALLVIKKRL